MIKIINVDMQRSQIKSVMATAEAYKGQKYDSIKKRLETDEELSSIFLSLEEYPISERCYHCGKFACDLIHVGEEVGYDSCYTFLCVGCFKVAAKTVKEHMKQISGPILKIKTINNAAFAEMQKKLDESKRDRRHAANRICMLEAAVEDLQLENSRLEQKILNMKKPGGILHDR